MKAEHKIGKAHAPHKVQPSRQEIEAKDNEEMRRREAALEATAAANRAAFEAQREEEAEKRPWWKRIFGGGV